MEKYAPETPVAELPFVRKPQARALGKLGVETLGGILRHYPRRYEDRSNFDQIPDEPLEQPVSIHGVVEKRSVQRWRRRLVVEATLRDASDEAPSRLVCRWFNAYHVLRAVEQGSELVVYGTVRRKGKRLLMEHPEFELVEEDEEQELLHLGRIVPVHAATAGLPVKTLRGLLRKALDIADLKELEILLPQEQVQIPATDFFEMIHFPQSLEQVAKAWRQAILEEFFGMQLRLAVRGRELASSGGKAKQADRKLIAQLIKGLPFELTAGQKKVLSEIREDLEAARPMNRLLHGEVGSGKTLVAAVSLAFVSSAGWQGALMAPTQILAEQHFKTLQQILEPHGIPVYLRTGALQIDSEIPVAGRRGEVVVGTHALLHGAFDFERLGLVVIDEQHKFGVAQRAKLRQQGELPDVLVMTATPIPRTLTLTVYGDLAVSKLDQLPSGRGEIITRVRERQALQAITEFIRKETAAGRQVFIVHPFIDESADNEVKAATAEYERWCRELAPARVGLLHGRLEREEREQVMADFAAGATAALVATTVVEVGLDVPNASVMLIEDAQRFGLAQLHQLRGRVGRGKLDKSYCILMLSEKVENDERERLQLLEQTGDGFEIAELDIQIRGPGDMLGRAQSGLPALRLGHPLRDAELLTEARELAHAIVDDEGKLKGTENEHLTALIVDRSITSTISSD